MLEPLSTTLGICCLGYAALNPYARMGSAVSAEAVALTQSVSALVHSAEKSQTLFGRKNLAISQLMAMGRDCAESGWDGADACAIDFAALANAERFIRALPDDIPLPEFAPEPDGAVSLDWIASRHRLFSLSISASNRLAYAWLDGTDKGHGVARFDGLAIPVRVLTGILSIVNHENASIRAA
jgi:hypothetical protein